MIQDASEDTVKDLEGKYGDDLFLVDTPQGNVIVRRAKRNEIQMFQHRYMEGKSQNSKIVAAESLALQCTVYPNREEMAGIFERYPLLPVTVAEVIIEVAQGDESSRLKW